MKPTRILVGTDFSPASDLAVRRAASLAKKFRAELRLIHAIPPKRWLSGLFGSHREWTQRVLGQATGALRVQAEQLAADWSIDVSTGLVEGRATLALMNSIALFEPSLVVIGARGEGEVNPFPAGLGHTAFKMLASTATPLLLVRRKDVDHPARILAALDLTMVSRRVLQWSNLLAGKDGFTAMHVYQAPFAERLLSYGVSRRTIDVYAGDQQQEKERELHELLRIVRVDKRASEVVVRGDAIRVILAKMKKQKTDTLVLGKHTRRKRDPAEPYGSVCQHLARFASADVLVVP